MEHRFKVDDWNPDAGGAAAIAFFVAEVQEFANRAYPKLRPPYQSLASMARLGHELEQQSNCPAVCLARNRTMISLRRGSAFAAL